jgi:Mce-associated membrane protein
VENQRCKPDDLIGAHPSHDAPADAATDGTEIGNPAEQSGSFVAVRRRLDNWLAAAAAAAMVLFVGSAAFAGAICQPYLADRATAANARGVARTAAAAVTTLWTYTPETIDSLPDRAGQYLGGDFRAQYRKFLEVAITSTKQAQVTDKTTVVGVAVESLKGAEAVALVLTNTTATSPLTNNIPSLKYAGYRLGMRKQGSRWLVTTMATISFLDLTPKI